MSKPSKRKSERQRKRKQRKQERAKPFLARKATESKFPEIVYDEGTAPDALVRAVRKAVQEVVWQHEALMGDSMAGCFQRARTEGFERVLSDIRQAGLSVGMEPMGVGMTRPEIAFLFAIGNLTLARLPETTRTTYFPFHDFQVLPGKPRANTILIRFQSLEQVKTERGTAYHSVYRPTIEFNEKRMTVAFMKHAVERICERTAGPMTDYGGLGDAFTFLNNCVYFEPCELAGGQPAFTFFNSSGEGAACDNYAENVLDSCDPETKYFYRVGYCPIAEHESLAPALTLLLPGMRSTPEFENVLRPRLKTRSEREAMEKRIDSLSYLDFVIGTGDFDLLREFHENGIPQVVTIDQEVFRFG